MFRILAVLAGFALAVLGMAAPAAASSGPPTPGPVSFAPTLGCQFGSPGCTEPVAAEAFPSTDDYVPADDAALATDGSATTLNIDNDAADGSEDWTIARIATVPYPGGGPGAFNFTGFDRHNYGGDPVVEIEWTPFGQDTGKCLNKTYRTNLVVVRDCNGLARQAWILDHRPPLLFAAHPRYTYVLSAKQALTAQHHLCATGHLFAQNTASRCHNKDYGATDTQRWAALP